MGFGNAVVAGIELIRRAIRSPNYVSGVSGWSINRDGSADLNEVTVRGTVTVGATGGSQVVISNVGPPIGGRVAFPTNRPAEGRAATVDAGPVNSGAAAEFAQLTIRGPAMALPAGDYIVELFNSQNANDTSNANVGMSYIYGDGSPLQNLYSMDNTRMTFYVPVRLVNVSVLPTATSGGGTLYSQAGTLRWVGSSGTVTIIAPA